jgi:hypothetical protein
MIVVSRCLPASFVLFAAACGGGGAAAEHGTKPPSAAASKVVLATDPGPAKSVVEAKLLGTEDRVVVTGRIALVVAGTFAFKLADLSMPYCGEKNTGENCKTPWDYCCETAARITANTLTVEARTADGKPIATPALPDLRLLDAVKVTGTLQKDEHGNVVLLADGVHRVARPDLPGGLRWPD